MRRLPIALPCARRCRVGCCYTIWFAFIIRCRSADLVGVQTNFRLLEYSTMRRAPAMPLFRTQSAAEGTSLAPHDSKARLRVVTTRRRFMAKPCTPHPHCAARAVIQAANCQCRGVEGTPLAFLLGFQRGILFGKRIPFDCALPCQWETTRALWARYLRRYHVPAHRQQCHAARKAHHRRL